MAVISVSSMRDDRGANLDRSIPCGKPLGRRRGPWWLRQRAAYALVLSSAQRLNDDPQRMPKVSSIFAPT